MIMIFIINLLLTMTECPKIPGCTQCNEEQTICHSCDTDLHYNYRPSGNAKCSCNHDDLYYEYRGSCQKVSSENCNIGCKYCFIGATYACGECDSSKHFEQNSNYCYCNSEEHFELGTGDDADKCVCKEGYALYKDIRCTLIEYGCSSGCESCYGYDRSCIQCKDKFELITSKSNHSCFCQEGYVLDEYSYSSRDRCIEAFPKSCPEGCNCDEKFTCISCKNDFLPIYYDDFVTLKSCNKTVDCPQDISDLCQKCNEEGQCLICKDGYIYSQKESKCILRDESIKCREVGCLQCSRSDQFKCDVCRNGFDTQYYPEDNVIYCSLQTHEPLKIIYMELTDNNIVKKDEDDKININLDNIEEEKRRPYYYPLDKNDENIIINNDNKLDFQFRLPYQNDGSLTIDDSKSSNKNPPYVININGKYDINYQSSNLSLEGSGEVTLHSKKDMLEINKLTIARSEIIINHEKDIKVTEINIHQNSNDNKINFISNDPNKNLNVSTSTFILHQNSQVKINHIDIDTLKVESKGSVNADNITVRNIEINALNAALDGYTIYAIKGNISGIPESIKIKIDQEGTSILLERIYIPYPYAIAAGYNEEFIQNCESWAKIYNNNPTDPIFNHAFCTYRTDYAELEVNNEDDDGNNDGGNDTGIIIGIVVGCVVVVGLVIFLLVYFLVIRKRKQNNQSSTQQGDEQQNEEE